jgi:exosortase/archaeosortase family protein
LKKKDKKNPVSGHQKAHQKPIPASKPQKMQKKQKPLFSKELLIKLLPLIKAFALWFILVLIVHAPGIKDAFRNFFVGFTTTSTLIMGKMFFIPIERLSFSGIMVDGYSMEIIVECTAYNFYLFAVSLVVFANWKVKHKIINLLIFLAIIFLTNILRFFAMGYVGRYYPQFFSTTHDYVWNILFGFMIFAVWAWRDKMNNPDFQPKDPQI